jgi:hypothetical protein
MGSVAMRITSCPLRSSLPKTVESSQVLVPPDHWIACGFVAWMTIAYVAGSAAIWSLQDALRR